tara:strand:+ start:490 stop:1305 length:816 start_codon:yes stop_codon:yes gene_type:complete
MAKFAGGKYALAISDRSGMQFPYLEMVKEWTGAWVHYSEFEPKQPQISPRPIIADPQGLQHVRPSRAPFPTPTILDDDPFSTILVDGTVTVYEEDHGRSSGDAVRFTQVKDIVGGLPIECLELSTTLSADISAAATTIGVASGTYFPNSTGYIVIEKIDTDSTSATYGEDISETIKYTGVSGNNLTGCTRGTAAPSYGKTPLNTTATTHSSGAKVYGSFIITPVNETVVNAGVPATITVSNKYTFELAGTAASTERGGGTMVFGGPVNQRP